MANPPILFTLADEFQKFSFFTYLGSNRYLQQNSSFIIINWSHLLGYRFNHLAYIEKRMAIFYNNNNVLFNPAELRPSLPLNQVQKLLQNDYI